MDALIRFLRRFTALFVFLLLEAVALFFLFNNNTYQRSILGRLNANIAGVVYTGTSAIGQYFNLKSVNRVLAEENATLREQVVTLQQEVERMQHVPAVLSDSLSGTNVHLITAKVVYNSVNQLRNYIVIDKGALQGVQPDMGVINNRGVVGIVRDVHSNYATVISMLNNLPVSGKFASGGYLVSVEWDGRFPNIGRAERVPRHVTPKAGDVIVTSGYSAIFPENIPIGTVRKVALNNATAEYDLIINFAADFTALDFVEVVQHYRHDELTAIEHQFQEEKNER